MKKHNGGFWISCQVSPGMFSFERGVDIPLPGGDRVSAFVDNSFVHYEEDPQPGKSVPGSLTVLLIERKKDHVILQLPGGASSFSMGSRFSVPPSLLKRMPA